MKEIIIKTQKEWDILVEKNIDDELALIIITDEKENLKIETTGKKREVCIKGFVHSVYGSAQIRNVSDSAQISDVYGSAQISNVSDSAQISNVYGSAQISYVSDSAQISNVSDSAQINYVYGSAQIRNVSNYAQISYVSGSAKISDVYDSAQISYVSGSAQINYVYGSAQIRNVSDSAQISDVYGSAQISNVSDSAQISDVSDSAQISYVSNYAQISYVYGSAKISDVYGYATIFYIKDCVKIETFGHNTITYFSNEKNIKIKASNNTTINKLKTIKEDTTLEMYLSLYHIKNKGKNLVFYKTVHKVNGEYISNHNSNFKYTIGEEKTEEIDNNIDNSCSRGIHISDKMWAINFGTREDVALLECLVNQKDIVISKDCDGKVRCSKLKVLREVPKEERFI